MINGANRSKFKEQPEVYFKGKAVCVTGKVVMYREKPEIVVEDPSELKLDFVDTEKTVPAPRQ